MARQRINGIELYYELTRRRRRHRSSWSTAAGPTISAGSSSPRCWPNDTGCSSTTAAATPAANGRPPRARAARTRTTSPRSSRHSTSAPVHLVGNSYGASIALGLAARRPDLVRSVIAHEPPLLGVARPGTALAATADQVHATLDDVAAMLRAGDLEGGARHFIEAVALGPGTWQMLPDDSRRTFIANAATFLDTIGDPHWDTAPEPNDVPVLLTDGDASPIWLPQIVAALAATTYHHAARHTFLGAGHIPHLTHPSDHAASVTAFTAAVSQAAIESAAP